MAAPSPGPGGTAPRLLTAAPQFTVADVVRTAEHYRDVFGFTIAGYWQEPPVFAIVRRDDVEVFFNRAPAGTAPRSGRAPGAYDVYVHVREVDALATELVARGAEVLEGPEDRVYGMREVVVADCNGLVLAFGADAAAPRDAGDAPASREPSPGLEVRPVRLDDAPRWTAIRAELWPEAAASHGAEVASYFGGAAADPRAVLVAVRDGELVGFAELSERAYAEGCSTSPVAYLEGWFVAAEARRQGVGRALVGAAAAWGRARGRRELASDIEEDNELSAAAHRGCGFAEIATIRCFLKPL